MNMKKLLTALLTFCTIASSFGMSALFATPAMAASSGVEISGWIPYWATANGTADAQSHINQLSEVNPFGYSVKTDGTLSDTMNIGQSSWQNLISTAKQNNVRVVPTIMWSDTDNIYNVLANPTLRAAHIASIVSAVTQNGFGGVDIDYEGKSAETRDGYSAFLMELSSALNKANPNAVLDCTIEARMPLEARYSGTPPANIEYANDLPTVNKYCDRVRIMTYDQDTADLQLNAAHKGELYAPVSDTAWVEKVVNYMSKDISKNKLVIGVATYGTVWQAMANIDGSGFTYTKIEAFNPKYGIQTAQQYNITPTRNSAGELSFSYVPAEQSPLLPNNQTLSALAPGGTPSALLASVGALNYAKAQTKQAPVQFLTWSDAQAIADKAILAKRLGVAGIAIFKFDGSEDPAMWSTLATTIGTPSPTPGPTRATLAQTSTITTPTTTSTSIPEGCTSTTAFSPLNGQRCPTPTVTTVITAPVLPVTPGTTQAASVGVVFKTDLAYGNDGADVTRLQKILITKGYLKATANGHFGPATLAAVKAWQKASGLPSTGMFGPQSRAKIGK
ncbi:MAG: glycosyl hydrolase family 18 protein [Candidatus Paceibacterota bacterium]